MTTLTYSSAPRNTVSPNKQILSIQYLRGLAALTVVGAHAGAFGLLGQAGVDVFFVISGFIMWTITSGKQDIYSFLKHRVLRIVPLYWIATVLMGLHQKAPLIWIVKSMLFIPFFDEFDEIWPVVVQGWTLNYEVFFYLLVAISLLFVGTQRLAFIFGSILILSCVGAAGRFSDPLLATYTNPLLLEFCFGIILAETRFRFHPANVLLGMMLGLLATVLFWLSPTDRLPGLLRFAVWGVPSALLVASALLFEAAGWVRRVAPLLVLGDASYAIYLFHTFIVKTVLKLLSGMFPIFGMIAVLACASVLGIVIAFLVEKPLLNVLRGARSAKMS